MSVINSQPLIGASGNQGGAYNIERSLRFRGSATAHLTRTPSTAGDRQKWTWSAWVKIGSASSAGAMLSAGTNVNTGNGVTEVSFQSDNTFAFTAWQYIAGTTWRLTTNAIQRDPSGWYHMVVAVDTTQATSSNRVKLYINGVEQTSLYYAVYPSQNYNTGINSTDAHAIGKRINYTEQFDGYLAEYNFIDGQQLTPSSFGETDTITGVWKPKRYTGTYGTNGFYLKFNNLTSTSTLGNDSSGNSNTWTVNNVSLTAGTTYDSMTDVPTLTSATAANYAVLNPINVDPANPSGTITNGNLNVSNTTSQALSYATIGFTSSKYYYEYTVTTLPSTATAFVGVGASPYGASTLRAYRYDTGEYFNGTAWAAYGATWTANDVIGIAIDMTGQTIEFFKNGTSQGQKTSIGLTGTTVFPLFYMNSNNAAANVNFGQRPFAYTPPSGFVALNTFNLPTSTIVAGNTVMDATLYTGNNSTQSITNAGGFSPDLVWLKQRSAGTTFHLLYDTNRGAGKYLASNSTVAEGTISQSLTAFNSNGFSVGADPDGASNTGWNASGASMVAWQWRGSDSAAVTNTAGSITSTVSANPSAGFSIVTYTGTGTTGTVGHGLGVAPNMIITKNRSSTGNWYVYHSSIGNTGALGLNGTGGTVTSVNFWNNTSPTSSVYSVGTSNELNGNGITQISYCWSEVAGFSKFGSYVGNGSADGTFVYTGFRPKWIIVKRSDSSGTSWLIIDTSLNPSNNAANYLIADNATAQNTDNGFDILSNGFKVRNSGATENASGGTYIYAAFAEVPTKFALAR